MDWPLDNHLNVCYIMDCYYTLLIPMITNHYSIKLKYYILILITERKNFKDFINNEDTRLWVINLQFTVLTHFILIPSTRYESWCRKFITFWPRNRGILKYCEGYLPSPSLLKIILVNFILNVDRYKSRNGLRFFKKIPPLTILFVCIVSLPLRSSYSCSCNSLLKLKVTDLHSRNLHLTVVKNKSYVYETSYVYSTNYKIFTLNQ